MTTIDARSLEARLLERAELAEAQRDEARDAAKSARCDVTVLAPPVAAHAVGRRELAEARQRAGDAEERYVEAMLRAEEILRERDAARAALCDLVAALGLDDAPRRAAIDAARARVAAWGSRVESAETDAVIAKVGDRVRHRPSGRVGTIDTINDRGIPAPIRVRFGDAVDWCEIGDLEAA